MHLSVDTFDVNYLYVMGAGGEKYNNQYKNTTIIKVMIVLHISYSIQILDEM